MNSVLFPLIVVREYHTPNGYMVHLRSDKRHYVLLNDGITFSIIYSCDDWDSDDDKLMVFFCLNKVDFHEND